MSSAPSGWQNPKTNWNSADVPLSPDFDRIEGNIQAIESGSRTLDPSQAPSGNSGTLRQILSWFANRIKAITGASNWYDSPATTLAATKSHMDATAGIHGATSGVIPNRLIIRDVLGQASVAGPTSSSHIATKGYVDGYVKDYVDGLVGSLQAGTAFAYYLMFPDVVLSSGNLDYDDWRVQDENRSVVVRILLPGTIRYHVEYRSGSSSANCYVRILRNGSQIREVSTSSTSWQTTTGNITVNPGDFVTIQKRGNTTSYWRNVRIETNNPPLGIQRF